MSNQQQQQYDNEDTDDSQRPMYAMSASLSPGAGGERSRRYVKQTFLFPHEMHDATERSGRSQDCRRATAGYSAVCAGWKNVVIRMAIRTTAAAWTLGRS